MLERQIKELSIALEAISRLKDESRMYDRIHDLLGETVEKLEEQHSVVVPTFKSPPQTSTNDDDIPF